MAVNTKRVFYVKYLASPRYGEVLAGRPEIRLDKLENDGADAEATPILGAAHAYQIGSARDELDPKYHAGRGAAGAHAQPAGGLHQRVRVPTPSISPPAPRRASSR